MTNDPEWFTWFRVCVLVALILLCALAILPHSSVVQRLLCSLATTAVATTAVATTAVESVVLPHRRRFSLRACACHQMEYILTICWRSTPMTSAGLAVGIACAGALWLLKQCAAQQVPRRPGAEERTATAAVAQPPRRPRPERDAEEASQPACESPARETSPPRLPVPCHHCRGRQANLTSLHYIRRVCKRCAVAHHAMHEHLEGEPPAGQGPRKLKTWVTTPEVTFKINEQGTDGCTHEGLRTSATNQFGVNFRCSCGLAFHARYAGLIRPNMPYEDLRTQVRAAISGPGW